jgi:3-methyladenine DNA glycosylase Tag
MVLDRESARARYRRLAQDCLETAQIIQNTESLTALIEMAQVWQRLANQQRE